MTDYESPAERSQFPQEIVGSGMVLSLMPGQVYVEFADILSPAEIKAFHEHYRLELVERAFAIFPHGDVGELPLRAGRLQWTTGDDTARFIANLRTDDRVQTASPVYHRADLLPADTATSFSDRVLVHFGPYASEKEISALITSLDTEVVAKESFAREGTIYQLRLRFPKQQDIFAIVGELAQSSLVRYAGPDWIQLHSPTSTTKPNDPQFGQQWNLHTIAAPQGWDYTEGTRRVVIAIIDSGCDLKHPDLVGKLVPEADRFEVLTTYPTDRLPTDPPLGTNTPNDLFGHGTWCAGIAAAQTDNNTGIAGVAPNCSIMPIRLYDGRGDKVQFPNVNFPVGIRSQNDTDFSVVRFRPTFMLFSEKNRMKVHKTQWLLTILYPLERLAGAASRGQTIAPEGQKPSQWLCLTTLPREMYS